MIKGINIGLGFLLFINVYGFLIMGLDKRKARKNAWRTPEKTFFITALLGGSIGVWLGMQCFRHKTQHKTFNIGIPLIFLMQVAGAIVVSYLS